MPDEVHEFQVTFSKAELEALAREACLVPKEFLVSEVSSHWGEYTKPFTLTVVFTVYRSANNKE